MLSKEASSTIFWVFGMTRPGIERGHHVQHNIKSLPKILKQILLNLGSLYLSWQIFSLLSRNLEYSLWIKLTSKGLPIQLVNHILFIHSYLLFLNGDIFMWYIFSDSQSKLGLLAIQSLSVEVTCHVSKTKGLLCTNVKKLLIKLEKLLKKTNDQIWS